MNSLASKEVDQYLNLELEVTIKKSLEKPNITTLINKYDVSRVEIAKHVDWIIEMLTQTINVTRPLTEFQKKDLVFFIMDSYKYETIDDLILCFKMAKNGQLGPIYNRIDREVIGNWMTKFLDLKAGEREAANLSGAKVEQKEMTQEELADWYRTGHEQQKRIQEITNNFNANKAKELTWKGGTDVEYKQFRNDYIAKASNPEGGNLGESKRGAETEAIPVPIDGGVNESDSLRSEGSEHSKQDNGIPSSKKKVSRNSKRVSGTDSANR